MTEQEHFEAGMWSVEGALKQFETGLKALREWKGDQTFEHPMGLAGSSLFLGAKMIGAGVAHRGCLPRDVEGDGRWDELHALINRAEKRAFTLVQERESHSDRDE